MKNNFKSFKELRLKRGLNQHDVAFLAGVSATTVSKYENGKNVSKEAESKLWEALKPNQVFDSIYKDAGKMILLLVGLRSKIDDNTDPEIVAKLKNLEYYCYKIRHSLNQTR